MKLNLRPRRLLRLAIELLVLLAALLALEAWLTRDAAHGPAPALEGLAAGERAGMVYFWGSWCPVCRAQQGAVDALSKKVPLLSVAMHSGDAAEIERYLRAHDLHWQTLADEQGAIARRWGVRGVPAIFIVDRQRQIRFVTRGYTSRWGLRLRLWWADHTSP